MSSKRYLLVCLNLLLVCTWVLAQTGSSEKQLKDDGLAQKQVKLQVRLFFRDGESSVPLTNGSVTISIITNSNERYSNGKAVPGFVPKFSRIGSLNISDGQPLKGSIKPPAPGGSVYFYLFYGKDYLIEIESPGYINQKFTINTTIPQAVYDGLVKRSGYFNDRLRNYQRYVDLVPCTGNCTDTSKLQRTVSYSADSSLFNMIINRPVDTEVPGTQNDAAPVLQNQAEASTAPNSGVYTNGPAELTLIGPSPGASAFVLDNDTINLIDINDRRQGRWIYFGSDANDPNYEDHSKYFEGNYQDDARQGAWIKFYPNADTAAILNFNNSTLSGEFSFFFLNGVLEQNGYWNSAQGSLNGNYHEFYDNGALHKQCQYDNVGQRSGVQTVYYLNGNTAIAATMKHDTLQGYMNYYLENGKIFLQQFYENGILVTEQFFGNSTAFPLLLHEAFAYLFVNNVSLIYQSIQNSLVELSGIDNNYAQLLRERNDQLLAANLKLSEKEKDLWRTRNQLSRSELEAEFQTSEVQRQKIATFSMIAILVLMIVLSVVLIRNNNRRKKSYRLLQLQKEEIHLKKKQIEEKNKDVADSIEAAGRIQRALLASRQFLERNLSDYFIFFRPRDVVSGDFYWAQYKNGKFYIAVCDSTGHGVPGAFMSLLNMTFLNQALIQEGIQSPEKILDYVRLRVVEALNPEGATENSMEGMDAALMVFDLNTYELQIAGANSPVWIFRSDEHENQVIEIKGDKQPIGYMENPKPFHLHKVAIKKGDVIYAFSDGYSDQFGGEKAKKFKSNSFRDLLSKMPPGSMISQLEIIRSSHEKWKGELDQVDDICVLGIRV